MNTPTTINCPPTADRIEMIRAVQMIAGVGTVCELRALEATMRGDRRWPCTVSGYFNDAAKLADAVLTIEAAKGIYLTLNPVDPALLARCCNRIQKAAKDGTTGDHHIIRRRWLYIDIDPVKLSGISATAVEHAAAVARAGDVWLYCRDQLAWGDPLEIDSGNGYAMLYPISHPAEDGGLIQKILADLSAKFSDNVAIIDKSVHNSARIVRLPGTWNCKGDSTLDRPHRVARIVRFPREMAVTLPFLTSHG